MPRKKKIKNEVNANEFFKQYPDAYQKVSNIIQTTTSEIKKIIIEQGCGVEVDVYTILKLAKS